MKFGYLIIRKIFNFCNQMSDFKAKMHKIQFQLRLRSRPRYGSSQRSPDLPAEFKRLILMEREAGDRDGKVRGERRRRGNEREEKRGNPKGLVHTPVSEILKNTLIAEQT